MSTYKIAIPEFNGQVNPHFGHSASFAIVEIDQQKVVNVESVSAASLAHNHEGLAGLLKDRGVEKVVVGGIGPYAAEALQAAGLNVLTGAAGNLVSVAEAVAKSQFISTPGFCNHGEGHHHGNHYGNHHGHGH